MMLPPPSPEEIRERRKTLAAVVTIFAIVNIIQLSWAWLNSLRGL